MLLTTTGHGLYLSSFMSDPEKKSATIALMISLPLSSAIGTWIAIGGSYYLNSVAFPAANMYVLTRLVGGLVITFTAGLVGFVIVSAVYASFQDGIVFLLYFVVLTSYLSLLAVLSSYQYLGSAFQNGRTIILSAVPIPTLGKLKDKRIRRCRYPELSRSFFLDVLEQSSSGQNQCGRISHSTEDILIALPFGFDIPFFQFLVVDCVDFVVPGHPLRSNTSSTYNQNSNKNVKCD